MHAAIAKRPIRPIEDNPGARKGARDADLQGLEEEKDKSEDTMDDEDDEDKEEGAEEGQQAKGIRDPQEPTKQEIEDHELTHIPFRDWCVHCCKGKSRSNPHRTNKNKAEEDEENVVTTVSMDYMYLTEKGETVDHAIKEGAKPIMVVYDRKTKSIMGHLANNKGASDDWLVKNVITDIEDMGYTGAKIILKNDQEPAILEVQQKIMAGRTAETAPKNSEVGDSQSNGEIENGIKKYQEQFRTLKDNLEANTKLDISMKHAPIPWLIEWTGSL